jgi:hypothetical protein
VTVPGRWIAANVPYATYSRATTLTLPRAAGATTRVTLTPAPTKRRAAL